jgi:hypothetical protein
MFNTASTPVVGSGSKLEAPSGRASRHGARRSFGAPAGRCLPWHGAGHARPMLTILLIVLLVLVLTGGIGYYGRRGV